MRKSADRVIAVIGGGGFRTPRLLSGLLRHAEELGLGAIRLYDIDAGRARIMEGLGRHLAANAGGLVTVDAAPSVEEAARGADFVLITIRPGGEEGRVQDEAASFDEGVLGQETVGPGGFFLALRTIPVVLDLVRVVRGVNRQAWFINFSNPVGIVSEAVRQTGEQRFIGVCDTPHHLVQELARHLGTADAALSVESIGLNHLGWFLRVWLDGEDVLPRILSDLPAVQRRVRPLSFFRPEDIRSAAALPTEYVYLYLHAEDVRGRLARPGTVTRGQAVRDRSQAFYRAAAGRIDQDPAAVWALYLETLAGRSNSYLQQETETSVPRTLTPATLVASEGYERVAIDAMLGLVGPSPSLAILNVPSRGVAAPAVPWASVSEGPCLVKTQGPIPLPPSVRPNDTVLALMTAVKRYELATVAAEAEGTEAALVDALAQNPLVASRDLGARLIRRRLGAAEDFPSVAHPGGA